MPKVDIDELPLDQSSRYPPPSNKAVEGRTRKRLGPAAGLTRSAGGTPYYSDIDMMVVRDEAVRYLKKDGTPY